jgi:hypothetical protein
MDLEVSKKRGKFYVTDRESGKTLNKGKPFPDRATAVKYMKRQMASEKLGEAGEKLMPQSAGTGMPDMSALMGGGMPPLPGMAGAMPAPGKMDSVRMNPRGM